MEQSPQVRVGLGVMLMKDGKVLLGRRKGGLGNGEYAWPGGHLEYMESFEDCARREVREETGLEIENIRLIRLGNLREYAPKHYVDITLIADWKSGEPQNREPHKNEGWNWYDLDQLPEPLFKVEAKAIEAWKTGRVYWDE